MAAAQDARVCGRGSGCGQRAAFSFPADQRRLETEQASFAAPWAAERQKDKAVRGRRWVRDGTAGLSQLSFTEEVENISVPHGWWGGWSRAELANIC